MAIRLPRGNNDFVFALFFSGLVATCYFFFLYLIIQTAVTFRGVCLHSFWQSADFGPWSPFNIFVFVVLLFGLVASWQFVRFVTRKGSLRDWRVWYYGAALMVMGFWIDALWNFDYAMRYERGEVTFTEFTDGAYDFYIERARKRGPHVCEAT